MSTVASPRRLFSASFQLHPRRPRHHRQTRQRNRRVLSRVGSGQSRQISDANNDTLPFDIDVRFINERQDALAELAHQYFTDLDGLEKQDVRSAINALEVFSERLLVPTGAAGFRITTKIHPFWNIYINGLGIAVAEAHEPLRSDRAHSYRFVSHGDRLFDRAASWRAFREASIGY